MIIVINYGMGNLRSIVNALEYVGCECRISGSADDMKNSTKLILPGVGSFYRAMENLNSGGLKEAIVEAVVEKGIPLLGICLGMQLLADSGEEDGSSLGLGLIPGHIKKFVFNDSTIKIPHVGFNEVKFLGNSLENLTEGLNPSADYYFVHSYRFLCESPEHIIGWTRYGDESFASFIRKGNIYGTQFHPEKSQSNGLKILQNFCRLGV